MKKFTQNLSNSDYSQMSISLSTKKIVFFVNGSEKSSAGVRARMLTEKSSEPWQYFFNYRPIPKWQGIFTFLYSAFTIKPNIIYVMDTAYTGVIAGYLAKILLGCILITDTGDVAYELAKSSGKYSSFQLKLINWIEKLALSESNALIVRGSYHKDWLESQGINKAIFIPDGVNVEDIDGINTLQLKQKLNIKNELICGLIGTMAWSEKYQMCYGWDIIEALAFLKDMPIKALLIGDGEGILQLIKRANELDVIDQVIFTGYIHYQDLPAYLCLMDVCVSTQSNDLVGKVRTTGKLPLYLAYGKYVIATDVGEASRVLPGIGCLLPYQGVRDNAHPRRLAEHLKLLLNHPEKYHVTDKARNIARENFDYKILANHFDELIHEILENI